MHPPPPPPQHLNETEFLEPLEILNTKSNVNIGNIGIDDLYRGGAYCKYGFNNVAQF